MIKYEEISAGDRLRIIGQGAPGFAKLGDEVIVLYCNGRDRCDVQHTVSNEVAYFALTCGAHRLERVENDGQNQTPSTTDTKDPD